MYVSAAELRDAIGATELSSLATPEGRRAIASAKLDAIIAGSLDSGDPDYAAAVQALATIDEALANRSAYVDGFLGAYSPLPVPAPVPPILQQIVVALARFDLAKNSPSATVVKRYEDARSDLMLIQQGDMVLNIPTSSGTAASGFSPITDGPLPIYSRATTQRFQDPSGRLP